MNWLKGLGSVLTSRPQSMATQSADGGRRYSADDPRLLEEIRSALHGASQGDVMRNGAVNRAVRLHCECIAMLPLQLMYRDDGKGKAKDHPLYAILAGRPNNWQTPYEFKRLMMVSLLKRGAAYAQIVRSAGRVIQLQPLNKFRVEPKQNADWSISYHLTSPNGVQSVLQQRDILAVRDLDMENGISGQSKIDQARDAVLMAATLRQAAKRLFDNNMQLGGQISTDNKLSTEARDFLKQSMAAYAGKDNSGKWMLLENGLKAEPFEQNLGDNSHIENMAWQAEEISRIFGTPRPLLMMDETSWGSGIEQLGLFFISYGLAPQFVNWEQAVARDLMTPEEMAEYQPKFNDGALLRGSKKDQAAYFSRALGSGGGKPWMTQDEIRLLEDYPQAGGAASELAPAKTGASNVVAQPA
jgi:HK97 family phage portal protein